MKLTTKPFSQDESRTLGVVSDRRSEACFEGDQPVIVHVRPNGDGTRSPVWVCREGCAPGFEYVTTGGGRRRHTSIEYLTPECAPICDGATHRTSYLIDRVVPLESTCAPGAPSPTESASREREQERRVRAVQARWASDLERIDGLILAAESAPCPLSEELGRGVTEADRRLGSMEEGLEAWFEEGPEIARIALNHPREEGSFAKTARAMFLQRVHPGLPIDAKSRIGALRRRVDRMTYAAREARQARQKADEEQEPKRRKAQQALLIRRMRSACRDVCIKNHARCAQQCTALTTAACDACEPGRDACVVACDREAADELTRSVRELGP